MNQDKQIIQQLRSELENEKKDTNHLANIVMRLGDVIKQIVEQNPSYYLTSDNKEIREVAEAIMEDKVSNDPVAPGENDA